MADFSTFDEIYGNDETRNADGVPIRVGLNRKNEEVIMIVAEIGNPKHLDAMREYERALESSRRNQNKRRKINATIIAKGILIDWKGVIDKNGKAVPATLENKIDALMQSSRLLGDIVDAAGDPANFTGSIDAADQEEETAKN